MAHKVKLSLPTIDVNVSDFDFHVTSNGEKLGTLRVSKGNLQWIPRQHTYSYALGWAKFDDLAISEGRKRKVKLKPNRRRQSKRVDD